MLNSRPVKSFSVIGLWTALMALSMIGQVAPTALAQATNYSNGVTLATPVAIHDSSGNVVSTVKVASCSYNLKYYTAGCTACVQPLPADANSTVPYYSTVVKITYDSTAWSSVGNSGVVGIQVVNAVFSKTSCTFTSLVDSFAVPSVSLTTLLAATCNLITPDIAPADVKMRLFQVNQGVTDSSDSSGKTAKYTYISTSTSLAPWADALPTQCINTNTQSYGACVWLFANPVANGVFCHQPIPGYAF